MDEMRTTAFALTCFDLFLATLAAVLLIVLPDFAPEISFLLGANFALLFSLLLIARAAILTDRGVVRGTFWRTVPAAQRPPGEAGVRIARTVLEETWLRFAKGTSAAAIVLCALAYLSHDPASLAAAKTAFAPNTAHAMAISKTLLRAE